MEEAATIGTALVPVYLAQRLTTGAEGRSAAEEPAVPVAVAGSQSV